MTHHTGSCHCGAVRYSVDLDLTQTVYECNCSHCQRKGFLLSFVPAAQFTLESGADALTEYRFNKHVIAHTFCKTCGVQCFSKSKNADESETYAVNVRTIEDIDLVPLTRGMYDGKSY